MSQVQVLETPIKSEGDKKSYRLIKLQNGLKALLVHSNDEENTESDDMAAIVLGVKVGSFDDPPKVMGMAHFLEHIVFMGSEKYPGENSFNEFLTAHGGRDNASTSAEHTKYFFSIAEKVFPEAVDIFANQFIAPLLSKNAMQREREAVDSEFQMATSSNGILIEYIMKAFINENHSASQFDCGNLKTLKEDISDDDLHAELLKFFEKYVGNKMCLAVQSKRSLDDLQELIEKCFSAIKSGSEEEEKQLKPLDEIFKPEFYKNMVIMKPKTATQSLMITWTFPSMHKHYKVSPMEFIANIFGNDGEGGLKTYLKEKHLITELQFYTQRSSFGGNSQFAMPKLSITLTDKGLENVEEILAAVFSYLVMIKESPLEDLRRVYNDLKDKSELEFKFHSEDTALTNAQELVSGVMLYDDLEIIRGAAVYYGFDDELITEIINSLNERRFNLLLVNSKHGNFPKKEKYFGAEYDEFEFPERYQKLWDDRKSNPAFFIERPNLFKAKNFEIFVNEAESPKYPVNILEDEIIEMWHKLDNKFLQPNARISVQLLSPKYGNSIQGYLFMQIYDKMLNQHFDKTYSQQSNANLNISSSAYKRYYKLAFNGYNDKIVDFIDLVTKEMKTFNENLEPTLFETHKTHKKKKYFNSLLESDELNEEFLTEIVRSDYYHDLDLFHEIDGLTFENLQKFVPKFFQQLKIRVLVEGNLTKDHALNIANILKTNFVCEPMESKLELKGRSYQMPLGAHVFRIKSLMPNDDNSEIKNYYEIGPGTLRTRSLAKLLVSILKPKAFDYLRNKEQLGYSVGIELKDNHEVIGVATKVSSQEHKHPYSEVVEKLEIFMNDIAKTTIEELSDEEFESFKQARVKALLADEKTLVEVHKYNWGEVETREHVFNRSELAAKVTKTLTKTEFQEFFNSFTKPENMRKLSVHVIGSKVDEENAQEVDPNSELKIEFIDEKLNEDEILVGIDIEKFQENLLLHPVVKFQIE